MTKGVTFTIPSLTAVIALSVLGACSEGGPDWLRGGEDTAPGTQSVALVERDVEAPDVFQATDRGLWDGRPSLGGVWVAHPDVTAPERVLIRNQDNGKFVIGALFRKESATPGPRFQVSSDAAEAIAMLAGAPAMLNVTALRSEQTPEDAATVPAPQDPPAVAADPLPAAPDASAPAPSSSLDKPYIQIGIFSIEANARATADRLTAAGMPVRVIASQGSGRAYWRVIAGPAQTSSERADLLSRVKGAGFADAYAVSD